MTYTNHYFFIFIDLVSEYQQYQEATAEDEGEFDEEEEEEMA
jgi:tubulin beta